MGSLLPVYISCYLKTQQDKVYFHLVTRVELSHIQTQEAVFHHFGIQPITSGYTLSNFEEPKLNIALSAGIGGF